MKKLNNTSTQSIIDELKEREWHEILKHFPQTKELLCFPFLWSTSDYFSPNGNDTGFDVLAMFQEWNQHNQKKSAMKFLTQLCSEWEIDINKPYDEDYTSYASMTYFQSVVSLAIAVYKVRGSFEKELSELAMKAIEKYLKEIESEKTWEHLNECQEKLFRVQDILRTYEEC